MEPSPARGRALEKADIACANSRPPATMRRGVSCTCSWRSFPTAIASTASSSRSWASAGGPIGRATSGSGPSSSNSAPSARRPGRFGSLQRNWAVLPSRLHRRATLIADRLPPLPINRRPSRLRRPRAHGRLHAPRREHHARQPRMLEPFPRRQARVRRRPGGAARAGLPQAMGGPRPRGRAAGAGREMLWRRRALRRARRMGLRAWPNRRPKVWRWAGPI